MKMIGTLDDKAVFEFDRGKYVIVNPKSGKWLATWLWFALLGRNYDTFKKCDSFGGSGKCVAVLEANKDRIESRLKKVYENALDEFGQQSLKSQDEFYDSLKDGEIYRA